MGIEKMDFDKVAASWDENPTRVSLAKDVAEAIKQQVTLAPDMDALDFGCGTGLLTLQLQPLVRSITGVDSSQGMLAVFKDRISQLKLTNAKAVLCDLDKGDTLTGAYHLVVSSMTLHHVEETAPLLAQFYNIMVSGGTLCLADLDSEEGQFHTDPTGVFHNGFDRPTLLKAMTNAGFVDVQDMTAAETVKPARNGEMRSFTVFLLTGRKR